VKNKNILLVGGTGYIGRELYRHWAPANTVYYTGRQPPPITTAEEQRDYRYLDLGAKESIRRVLEERSYDYIIFLAAKVQIDLSGSPVVLEKGDPLYRSNVEGVQNFMEIAQKIDSSIIYFSSMTVYDKEASSPVSENSTLSPFHTYGKSKVLAEEKFAHHLSSSNSRGAIVRIPGIFGGSRQGGYIHNVLHKLQADEPVHLDVDTIVYWEALYVRDLVVMLEDWIAGYRWPPFSCERFNLCYGEETDFVRTAYFLKTLTSSKSVISLSRDPTYATFYMDNTKISQYWTTTRTYGYHDALRHYAREGIS
jgi:nucleoside-diphosphate-sugar epimerase